MVFRQGEVVVVRGDAAVGVDVFPAVRPLDGDIGELALAVRDAVAVFEGLLPGVADQRQVVAGVADEDEAEAVGAAGGVFAAFAVCFWFDDVGRRDSGGVGQSDVGARRGFEDVGVGAVLQEQGGGCMAARHAGTAQGVSEGATQGGAGVGGGAHGTGEGEGVAVAGDGEGGGEVEDGHGIGGCSFFRYAKATLGGGLKPTLRVQVRLKQFVGFVLVLFVACCPALHDVAM